MTQQKEVTLEPEIATSMLWTIGDILPDEDSVMVVWGAAGASLFWLRETEVSELYMIESERESHRMIEASLRDEERGRYSLHYCPFESEEGEADYSLGAYAPIERAHVMVVDGENRDLCVASCAAVGRPGSVIFLHDSEDKRNTWILSFMEKQPGWAKCGEWLALPDDGVGSPLESPRMIAWTRLG